jgi:hypothetical protein
MSAVSGPTIGALLLYQLGYWLSGYWPGAKTGMEGAPAGWANIAFVYYAMILAAPGAAAFGALGSWFLIRRRDRGAPRALLYRYGALLGIVFGWLCLPTSVLILAIPFIWVFHAGTLGNVSGLLVWFDPRNPFAIVAGLTGLILGLVIAWIVARGVPERSPTR